MKKSLPPGTKIVVFDQHRVELGEGTLIRQEYEVDRELTVYECEEHVILAKGEHYLKVAGVLYHVAQGAVDFSS